MYDVVALLLAPDTIRYLVIWTLCVSALTVAFLMAPVTRGAGWHCPLAFLRGVQRFFLICLAVSLAYVAAYTAEYEVDAIPVGPLLVLFINFMLATIISGIRHLMAPAIMEDNTWGGALALLGWRVRRHLLADAASRIVPPVR